MNTGNTWSGVWLEYGSSDAYGNWVALGNVSESTTFLGGIKNCFPNKAAPKWAKTAICATLQEKKCWRLSIYICFMNS